MRILILLLLLVPSVCMARKYKLLVINRDGITREIITIHESGGYYDSTKVLWDERTDGELPSIARLQGTLRVNGRITYSSAQDNSYRVRENQRENSRAEKRSEKSDILERIGITEEELTLLLNRGI